jgi:aminopeptidase N
MGFLVLPGNKISIFKLMKIILFVFLLVCSLSLIAQDIDVLHYNYAIELRDQDDTIKGTALITLVKKSDKQTIGLDLAGVNKEGKGMKATVTTAGEVLHFTHTAEKLIVDVPNYKAGDTVQLSIGYKGVPTDGLIISKNKYGERTFFADNWPNRAHFWIPCKDVPNDKASFEFSVTAPSQYRVISNGIKVEEKNLGNGNTFTHWKESTPLPTKVMVIGAAKFAVKEFPDSPPNIPVSAWIYEQDSTKGFRDYAPATEILKFFSSFIAPYPYNKLANVQSKTIFGGMENASAIFYSENSVSGKGAVEDLLAHEIAHQWFGDMASEKSFTHLWLSEGFATYFTNIYWQHKYGDEAFKKRLKKERDEVIQFVKTSSHAVVDSVSSYMDLLNPNSYQKGAWVLHILRNEVGDSVFQKIIRSYYQQYKGSNADTKDFEAVAEKVSGKELTWFFDQWLHRPGIPKLSANWKRDGNKIKIEIKQNNSQLYQFPLDIGIVSTDGKLTTHKLLIKSKDEEFKIESSGTGKLVLDPDTRLLFEGTISPK